MTASLIDKILNEQTLYGDLFPHDNIKIPLEYRRMCKLIHPDVCDDARATDAFAKLQEFYNLASQALSSGTWEATNYVEFKTVAGKTLQLKYMYHGVFEIGEGKCVCFEVKGCRAFDILIIGAVDYRIAACNLHAGDPKVVIGGLIRKGGERHCCHYGNG